MKPKVCPKCKSKNIIPIVYGMPGPEMQQESFEEKIHLGGCTIMEDNPSKYCRDCEHKF